jgi:hypothetical protein
MGSNSRSLRCSGGYKNLVISLQILMVAAILSLIPLLPEVLQRGGRPGAEKLRWSLFWVAISNAISDLCLDAFALRWGVVNIGPN